MKIIEDIRSDLLFGPKGNAKKWYDFQYFNHKQLYEQLVWSFRIVSREYDRI